MTPARDGPAAANPFFMSESRLSRTPETEVMASYDDVLAYDRMDHAAVNKAFADDFLAAFRDAGPGEKLRDGLNPPRILDVGTGTGLIPIDIGRRPIFARITLTDASEEMLARAKKNVFASGLHGGFRLQHCDAADLPFEDGTFDAVISNSLVHHLSDPVAALGEMARVLTGPGLVFVRDLVRPETAAEADALAERYGGNEEPVARELLRDSLHAAYTAEELEELWHAAGLDGVTVRRTGDRHVTLHGTPNAPKDA